MIDAHHHIWRQADLPWLIGPEQPRIFGPYRAIMRDYSIREYQADIAGTGIAKSVYVQANWAPNWAADEVAWVQEIAEEHGTIAGIVGYADFTERDVTVQLDKLKRHDRMRGIRQQLHWHENPLYRFAKTPISPATRPCRITSPGSPTMAGASTYRCFLARWKAPPSSPGPAPR
jgi:predicted TIM-barrel fold metal-dependent hydrolase